MASLPELIPVTMPADNIPGPPQGAWTYEDYAEIPDDGKRYEIIDGVLYMTPAPNIAHQRASAWILLYLKLNVDVQGLGTTLSAPVDVQLPQRRNLVQPDIVVVLAANRGIIVPSRIIGAPDLVVEIASPSTATYDRRQKMDAYARAGVPEYWLADPIGESVEPLFLEDGAYRSAGVFRGGALLPTRIIPAFPVRVEQFFA